MTFRRRPKPLPHDIPFWVAREAFYFITICGSPRGLNQFCQPEIGLRLLEGFRHYHDLERWYCRLVVLMPDHLHAILSFPHEHRMKNCVWAFKAYWARHGPLKWQTDFFDHRIRNESEFIEKIDYVRQNPVKAGLVHLAADWPFAWSPESG